MSIRVKRPTTKKPRVKPVKPFKAKKSGYSTSAKNTSPKKPKPKSQQLQKAMTFVMNIFAKNNKKPPVRYRRPVPNGMIKVKLGTMGNLKLNTGRLVEFKYGKQQKQGQVGGWKNDPIPVLLVFHDDKIKYVEGINTNYLSENYLRGVRSIMLRFPGVDGEQLYNIFKRSAKYAIAKGYRKYIRTSFRDVYLYVYENDLQKTIDDIAKSKQSKLGVADKAKNSENSK